MACIGRTNPPTQRRSTVTDDLTTLLRRWPYRPDEFTSRETTADDGRPILQIRVELGILQLEMDGRPDGQHPGGKATVLAGIAMPLTVESARALRDEVTQFEYRAQALLFLGQHAAAARDGDHMLQCSRLLHTHAPAELDPAASLAPLLRSIMIRARASAEVAMATSRTDLAKLALETGLSELRDVLPPDQFDQCNEVHLLQSMHDFLIPRLPSSQRADLRDRIQEAIAAENYELAAILRDELRLM
jgi:hypothetical protein